MPAQYSHPAEVGQEDEDNMPRERELRRRKRVVPDRGVAPADGRIDGHTWLDNPENLQKFFETISRASERARSREEEDKERQEPLRTGRAR
jgi:hypothetical protein